MTKIVPLRELHSSIQEQGRIRIGKKGDKGRPMSIDTFRFTSTDSAAIEQIAAHYGGTAQPWHESSASAKDQYEVITEAKEIRVQLAHGSLTQWYELWTGGGCIRRCDGEICTVPRTTPDGVDQIEQACLCDAEGKMQCKPKTRLTVVLPEIRFGGGWRLETSSWTAARALPGMERIISGLQGAGMVEGLLTIGEGKALSGGKTRRFKYPKLTIASSLDELSAGIATVTEIHAGGGKELGAGEESFSASPAPGADDQLTEEEVIEAFVIEETLAFDTVADAARAGYSRDQITKVGGRWNVTQ